MVRFLSLIALPLALAHTVACDSGDSTTPHPNDRLSFPVSVTTDPTGELLWVVSGNFDLGFRSAAVLAIDTETSAFVPELAFEVGGFPGNFTLLERDGRAVAGYVASRAEDRLYHVRFSGEDATRPTVECPGGKVSRGILHCPKDKALDNRRVTTSDGEVELGLGQDPFGLVVSPRRAASEPDLLLSAAMIDGTLSTLELADDGTPTLVGMTDFIDGLFALAQNPLTRRIYATSKAASTVSAFSIGPRFDASRPGTGILDPTNPWVTLLGSASIPEPARVLDRARDIAISRDGTRLYLAYRAPDSLVIADIADTASGGFRLRITHKLPLDDDPTDVLVVPDPTDPTGKSELVYVSCFKADRIDVVDPVAGKIVGGIHTGDGPSGMDFVANDRMRRLFVALFQDDAVGVVELDPASPYYHDEVAEIR